MLLSRVLPGIAGLAALLAGFAGSARSAPFMIIGNDEKLTWDDHGKPVLSPTGKDSVVIADLADPENPKIVANLPLENSLVGPPVNEAIVPGDGLALIADSVTVTNEGGTLKQVPTDKLFVIDLKTNPPKLIDTVTLGKQPSGLDVNAQGNLALVANRAGNSISVLKIDGSSVKQIDTVPMGVSVTGVAFTPDGKHALAMKSTANAIALLNVDGEKVTDAKVDFPTYIFPYNVAVTPDGALALTADNGNSGNSDGNTDAVSVIDLQANPPHVIDHIAVGDAPEGLAISPKGGVAVVASVLGSNHPNIWYYHKNGTITVLRIEGKKVTPVQEIEVGGTPEVIAFTPDGRYLYVGNFREQDFNIFRVNGSEVVDTGKRFKVPGHPGSARISPR